MAVSFLESWLRDSRVHKALGLTFAVLITFLIVQFKLDVFEYISYDLRAQYTPKPQPSGNIVIVTLDPDSLKSLQREPEAKDWTLLLQHLGEAKPRKIVSFINPNLLQGTYAELEGLAKSATSVPFVFGADDLPKTGQAKMEPLSAPFENVEIEAAPRTVDRSVYARDSVTRRTILAYEGHPTLHLKLASEINGMKVPNRYQGTFTLLDSTQNFIRFRNKGAFPTFRFVDVLLGNFKPSDFANKIVLIGRDTQEVSKDYVTTPLSKEMLALSNAEMHANALDTLILNQSPHMPYDWVKWVLTFGICLTTMYIVLSVRPGRGLLMLGGLVVTYCLFALVMFGLFNWVVPVAHPLVVIFICYYFVIPYRLIVENRRSWEYYQKNKLLTQVEELKSNFMRMMSHDLKTPLARIQGMAELMQKEDAELSENQKKALLSINESSEELTDFISSILSLSRIESKEVKLQLHSKDINQLIQSVVKKYDFLAKRKNIEVVLELEPMFSIKLDDDLIRQVLSNLLENAIKYSNEGTRVLISTEEVDGKFVIQVADQGLGIPPQDIPNLFTRFYRGRQALGDITGNGLGLYLAKYFIELHHGSIEVESEPGKGTTFTIKLPIDLKIDHQPFEQGGPYA